MGKCAPCTRLTYTLAEGSEWHIRGHWDSDGIASMSLALRWMGTDRVESIGVPRIGVYRADAIGRGSGRLLVLDYGIPGSEYERLATFGYKGIVVVDHHLVTPPSNRAGLLYCNPAALGCDESIPAYSASLVLGSLLYNKPGSVERVLMAVGIVGDYAPYIDAAQKGSRETVPEAVVYAAEILRGTKWSVEELRELADVLDSPYRLLDIDCIRELVRAGAEGGSDAYRSVSCVWDDYEKVSGIVQEALSMLVEYQRADCMRLYKLTYDAYITSTIGRALAAQHPDSIIVLLHTIPRLQLGFAYIRSITRDLGTLRRTLEEAGVRVGGKRRVLVAEYTPGDEDRLADIISSSSRTVC
ncbi:MAG: hypothetical protein F7C35_08375 [Desulfurococcales archaeon]|nr:hypothetical protein [Desulfurococcales archaeon]